MFSAPSKSKHGIEPMGSFSEPDLGGVAGGVGLVEAYTPELREKMVKLEKENQILRRRLDSSDTSYPSGWWVWPRFHINVALGLVL